MNELIKIAFVKFGGLSAGGTERFIQNMAAYLPKNEYDVTYFYCDAAPYVGSDWQHPDTDPTRKAFLEEHGVKLVKFHVGAKDVTKPHHPWLDTDFFEVFNEEDFDIIQTGRAGHPEFPFTEIHNTTIVDAICLPGLAERKNNVFKSIHISQFQADTWVAAGGEASKVVVIPVFTDVHDGHTDDLREDLGIKPDDCVYGMHQRVDDGIFSEIPLHAYKRIETEGTHFVMMGGSPKYSELAQQLGLKNFKQLPHAADNRSLSKFLRTLDCYAHGRADGETFSLCIAEAMSFGKPIISHVAPAMGHVETIGKAGIVAKNLEEYVDEMTQLQITDYRKQQSEIAKSEYDERLSTEVNMKKVIRIYKDVMKSKEVDELSDEEFWEQA